MEGKINFAPYLINTSDRITGRRAEEFVRMILLSARLAVPASCNP